jgi:hypothetical protein
VTAPLKAACSLCGSTAVQPGYQGRRLHVFTVGEQVRSTAGARGRVLAGPKRGQGYKVRWENGHAGWMSTSNLSHMG